MRARGWLAGCDKVRRLLHKPSALYWQGRTDLHGTLGQVAVEGSTHGCSVCEDCWSQTGSACIGRAPHPVVQAQSLSCSAMGGAQANESGA